MGVAQARFRIAAVALPALLCAACPAPPESRRVQGGGRGADIGNRSDIVELHGGSVIYPHEPCAVQGAACTGPAPVSGRDAGGRRP